MVSTVYDFFLRACHRPVEALRGVRGAQVDADGNSAIFWIDIADGRVLSANYKATTCTTLIGVCEHLSELAVELDLDAILRLSLNDLLELHPEIPPAKRNAAALALSALQSAASRGLSVEPVLTR